jgi:hypothetical protein
MPTGSTFCSRWWGTQHGYGIMQEVIERTNGAVRLWPATLYSSLKRLISGGLIEESEERPAPELDDARRNPRLNVGLSLYRYLANAFPHEFRMVYGEDLDRLGEDAVPQVGRPLVACRSAAAVGRSGDTGLLLPGAACNADRSHGRAEGRVRRHGGTDDRLLSSVNYSGFGKALQTTLRDGLSHLNSPSRQ